jgi:hypothetical protein
MPFAHCGAHFRRGFETAIRQGAIEIADARIALLTGLSVAKECHRLH